MAVLGLFVEVILASGAVCWSGGACGSFGMPRLGSSQIRASFIVGSYLFLASYMSRL